MARQTLAQYDTDLLQPCVSADGAEQVRAAEARRDALLARDPWCGFVAPEVP